MTHQTMEDICLALHALGPMTLTSLHYETGIPLPVIRTHLRLHLGDRYTYTRTRNDAGITVRLWSLTTPKVIA